MAAANAIAKVPHTLTPGHTGTHRQLPRTAFPAEFIMQSTTTFQNAQGVNISGNPNFHNVGSITNVYGGEEDGMKFLNGFISYDAQFDSSAQDPDRQCHPGTRLTVLKRMRDWIDNPKSDERISWLYGPAGAGKSAIAQTIARTYNRPKVAASFFFFRSDANRNDGTRLFTTLAYQIALSMPEMKDYIAHSLAQRPDLPRTDIETQLKHLLAHPFQILHEVPTQVTQHASAVNSIIKKYQELAPVVIIDGVDECSDDNLQRRFLKIIGEVVMDNRFPLRFLIVSRPEHHIETMIRRFQNPILAIDLANLEDANRDIEKYLVDQFYRIASEQALGHRWPGKEIINDIVFKSSGNFIFPSLVIRFVGDPDNVAQTQLDIVLNIKPPTTSAPFAVLDQLFLEILRRVPDQLFLTRYLTVLVARISVSRSQFGELDKDDAVLMHVANVELHAKLRRMRSLFTDGKTIDVHHKSFIDFLQDPSRSNQYYIPKQNGIKGYLEVFVDSLIRYASTVIKQKNHRNVSHFAPVFRAKIKVYPPKIELAIKDWQEVVQPLLDFQDELLRRRNWNSVWDLLPCGQCTVFHLMRELLHLCQHLGFNPVFAPIRAVSITNLRNRKGVVSLITTTRVKNVSDDLDIILVSLLRRLPETTENYSPNTEVIHLMKAILQFDCSKTARKVCFISDAQKLVDLLYYIIHAKIPLHPDAARKATLLALEIFARVPIVPPPHFFNRDDFPNPHIKELEHAIEILSQTIFANRFLDHRYIVPVMFLSTGVHLNHLTMDRWRGRSNPNSKLIMQIMLHLAKAIQYLHSTGVVLYHDFGWKNVILDSNLCPKICCWYSIPGSLLDTECQEMFSPEENVFSFGCTFYEAYTGVNVCETSYGMSGNHSILKRRDVIKRHLSRPEIPTYVWDLIQCCCAEGAESRPTIDNIVTKMEGWLML